MLVQALILFVSSSPAFALGLPVVSGAVQVLGPREVRVGERPVVAVAVPDRPAVVFLECSIAGKPQAWTSPALEAGVAFEVSLPVDPPTSDLSCLLVANFANGLSERRPLALSWTWVEPPPPAEPPPDESTSSPSAEEVFAPAEAAPQAEQR